MVAPPDGSLAGVVVARTRIAHVDGRAGLALVRGYPLPDLAARCSYEDVAWLVLHGELPSGAERGRLLARARETGALSTTDAAVARSLGTARPFGDALTAAMIFAEDTEATESDPVLLAERTLSRVPAIVAAVAGAPAPDATASYAARAAAALGARRVDGPAIRALEVLLSLESEHGLSVSTFAARVAASSGASFGAALSAACAALSGTRHGGATAEAAAMLSGVLASGEEPDAFARARVAARDRLPGFGHRIYKVADPRVPPLRAAMHAMGDVPLLPIADAIATRVSASLGEKGIHANIDFYAAVLLDALGIAAEHYVGAFALGVTAGWLAHVLEVRDGGRLVRPESEYAGPPQRAVP